MEVPVLALGEQQSSNASTGQMSSFLVVHSGYAKTPTKKLKIVMDIPSILAPTPFNMFKRVTIDSIPFEQYIANLFSSGSSKYSPIPPFNVADKGKGIAQTSNDDILKQIMPYMEEGGSAPSLPNIQNFKAYGDRPMTLEEAKLHMQETKKAS
ncbi:hypothetical protein Tco_1115026 [Tanacetum coccineum]